MVPRRLLLPSSFYLPRPLLAEVREGPEDRAPQPPLPETLHSTVTLGTFSIIICNFQFRSFLVNRFSFGNVSKLDLSFSRTRWKTSLYFMVKNL
ncbi:hypothetical protein ACFX2A_029117 [Malus domestica]